jgi:hypothetical protein
MAAKGLRGCGVVLVVLGFEARTDGAIGQHEGATRLKAHEISPLNRSNAAPHYDV